MNIVKNLSFIAIAALLVASCKDTSKDGNIETNEEMVTDTTQVKETAANLETTTFKIDGMTCPMGCAATIEQKLAKMDGVQEAKVDFESKTATISFDAAKQTPEKFVETVEGIADGAYKVSDVKNSGDKAYYDQEQEKEKKTKKEKKSKKDKNKSKEAKAEGCATAKSGGCCSAGGTKTSCGTETKAGTL
ncbi:MAG TPA: heavy-metal-associated domain-containing protein [Flavobacterium sp.]|nr:heavy-metal-associated domain-containing protein [Flavobacterium sp.]